MKTTYYKQVYNILAISASGEMWFVRTVSFVPFVMSMDFGEPNKKCQIDSADSRLVALKNVSFLCIFEKLMVQKNTTSIFLKISDNLLKTKNKEKISPAHR